MMVLTSLLSKSVSALPCLGNDTRRGVLAGQVLLCELGCGAAQAAGAGDPRDVHLDIEYPGLAVSSEALSTNTMEEGVSALMEQA